MEHREEPTPRHSWHLRRERFVWEQNAVVYFPLGGDSIPACYSSLFAVEAPIPTSILESILRFSLQTQSRPYPMGKGGNTNWPILVMSRLRILGEYTVTGCLWTMPSLCICWLNWTATGLPLVAPYNYPGLPWFFFSFTDFSSLICFMASRNFLKLLFVDVGAIIFRNFCVVGVFSF